MIYSIHVDSSFTLWLYNRQRCSVSELDLHPDNFKDAARSSKFSRHQRVLHQSFTHATYPSSADRIMNDRYLLGGGAGEYDGILLHHSASISSAFAHVRPESDGFVLPYSLYPRGVPINGDVSILVVDMEFLANGNYRMFYNRADKIQFDQRLWPMIQSQVVFVHKDDKKELEFAERELTPLDKASNSILRYSETDGTSQSPLFPMSFLSVP